MTERVWNVSEVLRSVRERAESQGELAHLPSERPDDELPADLPGDELGARRRARLA